MNAAIPERVTVRVSETEAWTAFGILNGESDESFLHQMARLVAFSAGAMLSRFDVELHPRHGEIGHRVDLYFKATPEQRCEIARALRDKGFEVVEAALRRGKV